MGRPVSANRGHVQPLRAWLLKTASRRSSPCAVPTPEGRERLGRSRFDHMAFTSYRASSVQRCYLRDVAGLLGRNGIFSRICATRSKRSPSLPATGPAAMVVRRAESQPHHRCRTVLLVETSLETRGSVRHRHHRRIRSFGRPSGPPQRQAKQSDSGFHLPPQGHHEVLCELSGLEPQGRSGPVGGGCWWCLSTAHAHRS